MFRKILNSFRLREQVSEADHIKTIAAGSFSYAAGAALGALISLISIPLVINALGTEQYGLFVLLTAIAGFLGFSDFGVLTALINKISYLKAESKLDQANDLISGSFVFFLGIMGALLCAGVVAFAVAPGWFLGILNINQELHAVSLVALLIITLTWIVNSIFAGILKSLLSGLNQLPYYNFLNLGYSLVYGISYIALLVLFKPNLMGIVLFLFIAGIVRFAVLYVGSKHIFPELAIRLGIRSLRKLLPILSYAPVFVLLGVIATLIGKSDVIAISHYAGLSMVGLYAISYKLFRIPADMLKFTDTAFPSIAELYKKGDLEALVKVYARVVRMNMIVRACILGLLAVYAKHILILWLGDGFFVSDALVWSLFLLFFVFAWTAPHVIMTQALFLYEKHIAPSVAYLLITVGLFAVLVPHIGIVGVPLAIAIGNFIANGIYLPWMLKKYVPIQPFALLGKVSLSILLPLAFLLVVYHSTIGLFDSFWWKAGIAAINAGVFLGWILFFGFSVKERRFLLRKLRLGK